VEAEVEEYDGAIRDVVALAVPRVGRVEETYDPLRPFRMLDGTGVEVAAVSEFLHHMLADDASPASLRSYAYELLAWFRFLWAVEVAWDRAGRAEARDFALRLKMVKKPPRQRRSDASPPGSVNPVTGKASPGESYAARTRRHARAAIRSFYEYHREMHGRPLVNPFPKARSGEEDINAHHNPMQPYRRASRRAEYQPREPRRIPRSIPDAAFNELFAALTCTRDRALIAFYISTGARASELLGVTRGLVAPQDQTIGVIRKGSRALQHLPASVDAFVWLKLYQREIRDLVPGGPDAPVWWTLRQPYRRLEYDAARMVFNKANTALGANWTLHDLRHSAAKRMLADPELTLADVQWVLGHAHITTTEIYTTPTVDEVVPQVLAHHARRAAQAALPSAPAPGYRPEVLQTLCGALPQGGDPA
jgi:site-specific recombinase XerD